MLFCLAWFFNFLIGGLSGVFLSDVPSDVTTHGSFFSMAHFHYTIMGGLVFTFFAAIYYWVPKMTGWAFNERLAKIHFWTMFIAFNSTFAPLFAIGFLGQSRRAVTYPFNLQFLNDWASVSAFVLGLSMLVFLVNLVYSLAFAHVPAGSNPWESRSIEWQLPSPVPPDELRRDPGLHRRSVRLRHRRAGVRRRPVRRRRSEALRVSASRARRRAAARCIGANATGWRGQLLASATAFFFLAFVFAYVYLRSLNNDGLWQPKGVDAPVALGTAFAVLVVASAVAVWLARAAEGRRALALGAGLALGVAALVVQVVEWATLGFGPTDGGYASVFVGWTGFYFLFAAARAALRRDRSSRTPIRNGRRARRARRDARSTGRSSPGSASLTWVVLYLVWP